MNAWVSALTVAVAAVLTACVHVPKRQTAPALRTAAPLDAASDPTGDWPERSWWHRYQDPVLDELIESALAGAPTIASAQARLDSARANVRQVGLASGVRFDAEATSTYQRLSDNGLFSPAFLGFHWYLQTDLGLRARYTLDLWGKQRRAVQSAVDRVRANRIEAQASGLNLAGLLAQSYFGWQADQARLALSEQRLANLGKLQQITELRRDAGLAREDDVHVVQLLQSAARSDRLALQQSSELRRVLLAALAGVAPSALPELTPRPLPDLPATLPADLSLDLLARRPDIDAAYWRVQSAVHNLDAVRAGYYPDLSLNALLGVSSLDIGRLLRAESAVPAIGGAIHLPFFDLRQLEADRTSGETQLAEAVAAYDSAVVDAARDVGQAALLRQRLEAQSAEHAQQVQLLVEQQQRVGQRVQRGLQDARSALEVQRQWLDSQDTQLQLIAAALSADIDLTRALGGGYQADKDPARTTGAENP